VRELYATQLAAAGEISTEESDGLAKRMQSGMKAAHETLKTSLAAPREVSDEGTPAAAEAAVETGVPAERLRELSAELVRVPEGFTVNPKLVRMLERRIEALDAGGIDWGQAESLAFATLLVEGIPVRMTGQDTERGTFSHRHVVLHDLHTGAQHAPIRNLSAANASIEVYNSPLSEFAALGFEYGYSVTAPEALVLWEAQFGDFINGAQVVVDQFLVSGIAKWRQTSRLTLLLPHGYEGNGPEHSSARLERFLQLAAQENIRIVNATTSAQYFHLLRRQALDPNARPLVVMTPKGLLRLKEASSTLADLAEGGFAPVLDDPAADRERVTRLVLTSGKFYYDLAGHELREQASTFAIARIEQLYPFPVDAAARLVASYPSLEEVVWAQEEPQNMGAWRAIRHRLEEAVGGLPLRYAGRPWRASPSEGYPTAHARAQDRIVREVLERPPTAAGAGVGAQPPP
jgi:2-oxoglutarate dehydrogenase complex dehydrogenase (E1) component-like enzyme